MSAGQTVPTPPTGPLLLVTPHADDAALSCAALLGRDEPIDVLTVFMGSPDSPWQGWWDRVCGFASSAESVPARCRPGPAGTGPGSGGKRRLRGGPLWGGPADLAAERARVDDALVLSTVERYWLLSQRAGASRMGEGS